MVKILILGGGFGGIRVALDLEKKLRKKIQKNETQITLIDKNSYHLFAPALYEVATAVYDKDTFSTKLKKTISVPYGDIFENKNINFIQAEVLKIDFKNKYIKTRSDQNYDFDYLVLALGGESSDLGVLGVKEYAYKFKTLEDALMLNERIKSLVGDMANGQKNNPINILIGGAGFTGIEVAAELVGSARSIARKCGFKGKCSSVVLFEAASKILPMASDDERKIILNRLTHHGIMVMENSFIEEVGNDFVKLKTGQKINGDLVVWTAGIKANSIFSHINGIPLTERGRIFVNETLLVNGFKNIFAIGDNIEFLDDKTKKPIPSMAFTAIHQGKIAAKNILNSIKNKPLNIYVPWYDVWVAPVGGKFALASLKSFSISGFWGWIIRELIDLKYMLSILPPIKAFSILREEITLFIKND